MTGRVSIRDVAREAGVSVTTVSHALNGKGRLNAETRKRVREVADRLGYRPNPAARSLVSGHTGLIAAIPSLPRELRVDFTEFGFFSELITAATGVAVGRDQALVVSPPGADWFIWDRVPLDGVIVIEALKKEGLFDSIKVMVGGAPVTQEWATEIGADGFAPDAPEAVSRAKTLLGIEAAA